MRAKNRGQEERFKLVEECRNSGLTIKEWCMQNNIIVGTLKSWVTEYNHANPGNQIRHRAKNRSQEERFKLVEECQNSALTIKEWCKQNNINAESFRHWVAEYNRANPGNQIRHRAKVRSQEERFKLVEECRNSALTIKEWCKQNNINAESFMCWATEYNHANPGNQIRHRAKNRSQEERFQLVEEFYNSNLTITEWCKRNDIKLKTFYYWAWEYKRANPVIH